MSEHHRVSASPGPGSPRTTSPGPQGPSQQGPSQQGPGQQRPAPGTPARPPAQCGRRHQATVPLLWSVALLVVLTDQLTKAWALARLGDGAQRQLVGDLIRLVLVRNPGAAFSLASGHTWIFSVVAAVVVVVVLRVSRRLTSVRWALVLGLVLGGAVGNLIDRLVRPPGFLRGHVIDFISYNGLFVGNVADIAIVVAAVGVIGLSLVGHDPDGARHTGDTSATGDPAAQEAAGTATGTATGTVSGDPATGQAPGEEAAEGPEGPGGGLPAGTGRAGSVVAGPWRPGPASTSQAGPQEEARS